MANKSLIVGNGKAQEIKGTLAIPGWQAESIWGGASKKSPAELAKLYKSSVWAYACIKIRADAIAGVEWEIYRDGDEENPLDANADAVRVLTEVNQEANWNDLIRATESDLLIFGRAFWAKQRGNGKAPRALMRLNPQTMTVKTSSTGIDHFEQQLSADKPTSFAREDVIYFREYDPMDDLGGLSPLQVATAAANAEVNMQEHVASFFKNGAVPTFVMSSDQPLTQDQADEQSAIFKKLYGGVKNFFKVVFTGYGMKPQKVGTDMQDLAMQEVMKEIRTNICGVFRVPPAVVGAWEAANYATAQEQRKDLIQSVVMPRAEYLTGVIEAEYLADFDPALRFRWLFDKLPIMAEDLNLAAQRHQGLVQFGIEDPQAAANEMEVVPVGQFVPDQGIPVMPDDVFSTSRSVELELEQWHRFAGRRLNQGQELTQAFRTQHIPAGLKGSIEGQLTGVKTHEELERVFAQAKEWSGYP